MADAKRPEGVSEGLRRFWRQHRWQRRFVKTFGGAVLVWLGHIASVTGVWSSLFGANLAREAQVDEAIGYLKRMQDLNRDRLETNHPLGYALFFADRKNKNEIVRFHKNRPGLFINWCQVEILKLTADSVEVRLPDVTVDSLTLLDGVLVGQGLNQPLPIETSMTWGRLEFVLEVFKNDTRGVVFLLGVGSAGRARRPYSAELAFPSPSLSGPGWRT